MLPRRTRVIALGRPDAGDDAIGPAVLDEIARRPAACRVELIRASDPTELLWWLETPLRVVIVDAVQGHRAGEIVVLDTRDVANGAPATVSSHGFDVGRVLALARTVLGSGLSPSIRVVGVGTAQVAPTGGLSPAASALIAPAADTVLALAGAPETG